MGMDGTSLVAWWLRHCAADEGGVGLVPSWKLSSHVCGTAKRFF